MAGGTTKIKVGFNAAALNRFDKDVFVKLAGVSQPKVLKISGEVMEPVAYDAYVKGAKNGGAGQVQTSSKTKTKTTSKQSKTKSEKA
jgi:hypothetical protein